MTQKKTEREREEDRKEKPPNTDQKSIQRIKHTEHNKKTKT